MYITLYTSMIVFFLSFVVWICFNYIPFRFLHVLCPPYLFRVRLNWLFDFRFLNIIYYLIICYSVYSSVELFCLKAKVTEANFSLMRSDASVRWMLNSHVISFSYLRNKSTINFTCSTALKYIQKMFIFLAALVALGAMYSNYFFSTIFVNSILE